MFKVLYFHLQLEISWVHLKLWKGETIAVFTPSYELNEQERGIIDKCTKDVHGLRFKRYSDSTGLWINNVKDYFIQLHNLYGGTFAMKGGGYPKSTFLKMGNSYNYTRCAKMC